MTFAFEAAEKLRRIEVLARDVLACELLVARQAWALRGAGTPAGLEEVAERLTETVAPVEEDRPLGPDLDRLVGRLESGEFGEILQQSNRRSESVR